MKIRNGFVSNSSSSSFVCEICYLADTVYDGGIGEIGMCECTNGHIICMDHLLFKDEERDEDNMVPSKACPICQLKEMPDHLFISYVKKRTGITKKDMLKDVRTRFKNWKELINYLTTD